jgi:hypothetical protein
MKFIFLFWEEWSYSSRMVSSWFTVEANPWDEVVLSLAPVKRETGPTTDYRKVSS